MALRATLGFRDRDGDPSASLAHIGDLPGSQTRISQLRRPALCSVELRDRRGECLANRPKRLHFQRPTRRDYFLGLGKYFDIVTFWIRLSSTTMPGLVSVLSSSACSRAR